MLWTAEHVRDLAAWLSVSRCTQSVQVGLPRCAVRRVHVVLLVTIALMSVTEVCVMTTGQWAALAIDATLVMYVATVL